MSAFSDDAMPAPAPEPFVDIHCHILPGIDDGAADWDQSLAMARLAEADGISTIVATPHQLGNHGRNDGRTIRTRVAQLQQFLEQNGLRLRILPGADVRIEPEMIGKIRAGEVLTLADRGRYVLLELPHEMYLPLNRLLQDLHRASLIGILSHPERNLGILNNPKLVGPLVDAGCLMQVTAGSLIGTFGPEVQRLSERLLADGLVHFLATDAHSPKSRRPLMRRSYDWVVELAGHEAARELCCRNPACLVADRVVEPGRRKPNRPSLMGWSGGRTSKPSGLMGWFTRRRAS